MKRILIISICLAAMGGILAQSGEGGGAGKRKYIVPNTDSGYYLGYPQVARFHPGDTIVLSARDHWSYFTVENFRGDPSRPLVIINEGGVVKFRIGIRLVNDSYIKLTGTGSSDPYGFLVEQDPSGRPLTGGAIQVGRRSKNIDIGQVNIHNCGIGFVCETNEDCADSLNYPNWVLDSISIHHCRIVGIWNEGMYIGNTSPDNAKDSYDPRPVDCGGRKVYPMPMRNGNIRVYDNYLDSTGRGGIQMASASTGMSEISHNIVRHCGLNGDGAQGTGISVGTYTRVYIHDNTVSNTYTWGIASLGGSGTGTVLRIENNRIDSSGYLAHYQLANAEKYWMDPWKEPVYPAKLAWPCAIELGTRPTLFKDSTTFSIRDNVIGLFKSGKAAIQMQDKYRTLTRSGNIICGNTNAGDGEAATVYIENPGGGIRVADCSGQTREAGWVQKFIAPIRHKRLWLLAFAVPVLLGLGYLVLSRRRRAT
jgi:hypothetical protein